MASREPYLEPGVYPQGNLGVAERLARINQRLGRVDTEQTGPELSPAARLRRVNELLGRPSSGASLERLSYLDPRQITPEARTGLGLRTTPMEELTGESYVSDPSEAEDEPGFLRKAGSALVESFNVFEPGIELRERVFRAANVGSLALPAGFIMRAPGLLRAFPMLGRLTATKRGQVAISAASEGLIAGSTEAIRGPDEHGEGHIVSQTVLGATLGGVLGLATGQVSRSVRRTTTREAVERFEDTSRLPTTESPFFTERYAILAPSDPAMDPAIQRAAYLTLRGQLERQGYSMLPAKLGNMDALLVPGLDERTAIDLARETSSRRLATERGLIDLDQGLVYPLERSRSAIGLGVEPTTDLAVYVKRRDGDVLFRPGYNTDEPVRVELRGARGPAVERAQAIVDDSRSRPFTTRVWEGFRNLDMGSALSNWYRRTVRQTYGLRKIDTLTAARLGKSVDELTVRESLEKSAELAKGRFGTFTESAMKHGVLRYGSEVGVRGARPVTSTVHEGLLPIWKRLLKPGEMQDFTTYGNARRAVEIAREHGEQALPRVDGKPFLTRTEAEEIVAQAPSNMKEAFDLTVTFQNAVLYETLVRSGVLTRRQFKAITERADGSLRDFVPWVSAEDAARHVTDPDAADVFAIFDPVERVLKRTEAEGKLVPWTEEIVRRTAMYARLADHQRLGRQIVARVRSSFAEGAEGVDEAMARLGLKRAEGPPATTTRTGRAVGELSSAASTSKVVDGVETFPEGLPDKLKQYGREAGEAAAPTPAEDPSAIIRELQESFRVPTTEKGAYLRILDAQGKPEWWQVTDQGVWEGLSSLGPMELGAATSLVKFAAAPASLLRSTVTLGFGFLGRNPMRDVVFGYVNAGLSPTMAARGLASLWKKDDFYRAWHLGGGPRAAMVSLDRPSIANLIDESQRIHQGTAGRLANVVTSPGQMLDALRAASETLENATRLGRFRQRFGQLAKQGANPQDALLEAALASKQVSVNFTMTGSAQLSGVMRATTTFWNAGIQGLDQFARSSLRDPKGVLARGSVLTGISAGLYMLNRQDEDYREGIPDWEKMTFWHFRLPGSDEWIRVPKPFEPGILFSSLPEAFMAAMDADDPRVLDDAAIQAARSMAGTMLPVPTVMVPPMEILANRDFFTGAPLVPETLAEVDPEFHAQAGTTLLAQGLARMWNSGARSSDRKISPLQIDKLFSGYTGELGRLVYSDVPEALADGYRLAVEGRHPEPRRSMASGLRRVPLVQGFYSTYPYSSQPMQDLYTLGEQARIAARTATYLEDSFAIDDYATWVEENAQMLNVGHLVQGALDEVARLRELRDQLLVPGVGGSMANKRAQFRQITEQMTLVARPIVRLLESQQVGARP